MLDPIYISHGRKDLYFNYFTTNIFSEIDKFNKIIRSDFFKDQAQGIRLLTLPCIHHLFKLFLVLYKTYLRSFGGLSTSYFKIICLCNMPQVT